MSPHLGGSSEIDESVEVELQVLKQEGVPVTVNVPLRVGNESVFVAGLGKADPETQRSKTKPKKTYICITRNKPCNA